MVRFYEQLHVLRSTNTPYSHWEDGSLRQIDQQALQGNYSKLREIACSKQCQSDAYIVVIENNDDLEEFKALSLGRLMAPVIGVLSREVSLRIEDRRLFKYMLSKPISRDSLWTILKLLEKDCHFEKFFLEHIPLGLLLADEVSGEIVYLNSTAATLLHADHANGHTLRSLFPDLATNPINHEGPIDVHLDEEVVLGVSGYRIPDMGAGIIIVKDITDLKKQKQKIRESERLIMQGKMINAITHEMGNPLAAMKTSLQVLRNGLNVFPREKVISYLNKTLVEIERLDTSVRDFLSYHRIDSMVFSAVDINKSLTQVGAQLHDIFSNDGILFHTKFETPSLFVRSDKNRMKQLLLNLLLNARDSVLEQKPNPMRITVQTTVKHGMAYIIVEDNGTGVTPATYEEMFLPFFTTKGNGTGLGLAISKQIVEKSGGNLQGENREEGGFRLTVSLPLSKRHPNE